MRPGSPSAPICSRPVGDQPGQVLAVVPDRERPAQLAVLVADRVEAVRARRDDRPLPHLVAVERLDVLAGEDLEHVLVAHPPGRVAGARLLLARAPRTTRRPRRGTSRPRARPAGCGRRRRPRSPPSRGPRARRARRRPGPTPRSGPRTAGPSPSRAAPTAAGPTGWPTLSMSLKAVVSSCGNAALLEHEVAPQADDLVDVLDGHRAGLDAGAAGQAVPDGVVRDRGVDEGRASASARQPVVEGRRDRAHGRRVGMSGEPGLGVDRHLADAHDERLGVERLAGGPRRAGLLAAAALGAREAVEQVLPRQVRDGLDAERSRPRPRGPSPAARRAAGACAARCWGSRSRCGGACCAAGSTGTRRPGACAPTTGSRRRPAASPGRRPRPRCRAALAMNAPGITP